MKTRYRIFTFLLSTFFYLSISFFIGCKKENALTPVQQNTLAQHHIKGFLGSEEITIQNNASYFTDSSSSNIESQGNSHHAIDQDEDEDEGISTLITGCNWHTTDSHGHTTTTGSVQIHKEVFRIYVTPFLSSHFYSMLAIGYYNFAYANDNKSGAYLTMVDNNGIEWTSKGEQSGSTFQITSRGDNTQAFTTITGTVACKMYDTNGNVKPFNGTFSAITGL